MAIGKTVAEIKLFLDFSKWRPSAILDLLFAYLDHSRSVSGGLYVVKNLIGVDVGSFDDTLSFNILPVWLENAYSCPKNVLGGLTPKWGKRCQRDPERHTYLRESASFEASSTKICRPANM